MADDKLDALGPVLNKIGVEMVDIAGGVATGLYLYVEAGDGWVGTSFFKDDGDSVRYIDVPRASNLDDMIFAARETEPNMKKRWSIMEYVIENKKFRATFKFSDEIDVENDDSPHERRELFLKARYGDKPVTYPPIPNDAFELRPEDERP